MFNFFPSPLHSFLGVPWLYVRTLITLNWPHRVCLFVLSSFNVVDCFCWFFFSLLVTAPAMLCDSKVFPRLCFRTIIVDFFLLLFSLPSETTKPSTDVHITQTRTLQKSIWMWARCASSLYLIYYIILFDHKFNIYQFTSHFFRVW